MSSPEPEPDGALLRVEGPTPCCATVDADLLGKLQRGPAWCDWPSQRTLDGSPVPSRNAYIDGKRTLQRLAHTVMGAPNRAKIWYRNGNTLDCRRANLVVYKGTIHAYKRALGWPIGDRYEAQIRVRGARRGRKGTSYSVSGGYWPTVDMAAWACAELFEVKKLAESEGWNRRQVREAADKAIGRIRTRRRRSKTAVADAAYTNVRTRRDP